MNDLREEIERLVSIGSLDELRVLKSHLSKRVPHPLEREWDIDADTILSAIQRSSDLTKRGVRGIIAEAVFESSVIRSLDSSVWASLAIDGNPSFDFLLKKGETLARIQVKLQRMESGLPKLYHPKHYSEETLYVVEVQRTRSGKKSIKRSLPGSDEVVEITASSTEETRPYRFADFDILAVNMHPSTGDWKKFRYTLAKWLLPRSDLKLIEIMQPVASVPNEAWTDDLQTCLAWLESGKKRSVLKEVLHTYKRKTER